MLNSFWHLKAFIDWMVLEQTCLWVPMVLSVLPGFLFLITVVMVVSCNYRHGYINVFSGVGDRLVVDVSCGVLHWLVINVSHGVLNWFKLGVSCVVGVACLGVVVVRALIVVVGNVSIERSHHCLVVLMGSLVLGAVVVEFDVGLNGVATMQVLLVVRVLHWMYDLMVHDLMMVMRCLVVHDLMMVMRCLMMHIIMDLMDVGGLVMGHVVVVVHWFHMVHVHIMVIEIVVVKVIV